MIPRARALPYADRRSERARRVSTLRIALREAQTEGRALARRAATYRRAAKLDDAFAARAAVAKVAWLNNRALAGTLQRRIEDLQAELLLHPVGWYDPEERAHRVSQRKARTAARNAEREAKRAKRAARTIPLIELLVGGTDANHSKG